MDERENFDAQREALNETAGRASRSTRERIRAGMDRYLAAEVRHAGKVAQDEQQRERRGPR